MKKKNTVFSDILTTVTKYFAILVVIVITVIAFSGIRIVKSGEVALILRFGKLVGNSYEEQVHEPGLLFAFPYVIDEVITVPTGSVIEQTIYTHYTSGNMTTLRNNGYVITGDQNIAVMTVSVKYVISDAVAYALNVSDINKTINACVSNAMVESAAHITVDDILTTEKEAFSSEVLSRSQNKLDNCNAGVKLSTVELTNVSMPAEVKETYELVNAATVQASTYIEQAKQYRENTIPLAEAEANTLISNANSQYASAVAAANTDLVEFYGTLEEFRTNPEVVRVRIFTEKMSEILSKIGKVKVVQDGDTKIFLD